ARSGQSLGVRPTDAPRVGAYRPPSRRTPRTRIAGPGGELLLVSLPSPVRGVDGRNPGRVPPPPATRSRRPPTGRAATLASPAGRAGGWIRLGRGVCPRVQSAFR